MIITGHGKFISMSVDEDMNDMLSLVCNKCGHALYLHGFTYTRPNLLEWVTSQCTECAVENNEFKCPQFTMDNTDE